MILPPISNKSLYDNSNHRHRHRPLWPRSLGLGPFWPNTRNSQKGPRPSDRGHRGLCSNSIYEHCYRMNDWHWCDTSHAWTRNTVIILHSGFKWHFPLLSFNPTVLSKFLYLIGLAWPNLTFIWLPGSKTMSSTSSKAVQLLQAQNSIRNTPIDLPSQSAMLDRRHERYIWLHYPLQIWESPRNGKIVPPHCNAAATTVLHNSGKSHTNRIITCLTIEGNDKSMAINGEALGIAWCTPRVQQNQREYWLLHFWFSIIYEGQLVGCQTKGNRKKNLKKREQNDTYNICYYDTFVLLLFYNRDIHII